LYEKNDKTGTIYQAVGIFSPLKLDNHHYYSTIVSVCTLVTFLENVSNFHVQLTVSSSDAVLEFVKQNAPRAFYGRDVLVFC